MSQRGFCFGFKFWDNALGQHFAEFHPPLVERVDVPDNALGKDGVLVECNKLAERCGRERLGQDRIRRTVSLENPVRHEPIRRTFGLHLLWRLAEG